MRALFATLSKTIAFLALIAGTPVAAETSYPTSPIKLVVPHAAGAITDTLARKIGQPLGDSLGQPIVIENKPGANTIIGTDFVVRAKPDGYTILLATAAGVAASPAGLTLNVPYDPITGLTPITLVASVTYVVLARKTLEVETFPDLIAYAKANPGKLNYGSGNNGGIVYMEMIKKAAAIDAVHVRYKSTPPAIIDLLAGHIDIIVSDLTSSIPLIRDGRIKALAVTSAHRSTVLPNLPTLAEAGLPGLPDLPGWLGIYGPAGMDPAVVARLNQDINASLRSPDMTQWAHDVGVEIIGSTPAALETYTKEQLADWRRLIAEFGLAPEN